MKQRMTTTKGKGKEDSVRESLSSLLKTSKEIANELERELEYGRYISSNKKWIPAEHVKKSIDDFENLLFETSEMSKEDRAKLTRKFDILMDRLF